jgi:hypothetical protein
VPVKSAIAALLSLLAGVLLGYAAFDFLEPSGYAGRDPTPIMILAALFLVASGFVHGRWWLRGAMWCLAGVFAYATLVGLVVGWFAGFSIAGVLSDWTAVVLVVTLLPWGLGVLAGKWARRITLTP